MSQLLQGQHTAEEQVLTDGQPAPIAIDAARHVEVVVVGNVPSASATAEQSDPGAVTADTEIQIVDGAVALLGVTINYQGTGTAFAQLHDAATATSPSDSTLMLATGWEMNTTDKRIVVLDFSTAPLRFSAGVKVAVSSSEITYAASTEEIVAWGQWGA